ncbi:ADP-ribosylglycohydrolase family protein [uncultured Photobacterium sp.]|uniref:ADP-ribosylglycohydrolase family protein n=1 Tax=uncultured Photobacterium sp. TaxID=173973 RepID=UPI00263042C0|nr:ADP-ribosylglycohydrolase family protein [uncultured Photobacterium sp.]
MTEYNQERIDAFIPRAKGALLGLALGDALGTTLEFKPKDSYSPITDMVGGGPFQLEAGQWTDDTSMALCLADSLLAVGEHHAQDQIVRYLQWRDLGINSVTRRCFDIGNTVSDALDRYVTTGNPNAGSSGPNSAGNGSLMRLAPVSIFFAPVKHVELATVLERAKASSVVTHAERRAIEGCQIMAWLLYQVFDGVNCKSSLFEKLSCAFSDLSEDMSRITTGSFLTKTRDQIRGTGFVVDSLEAALWCFANSENFEQGALLAASLGDDADTTTAIYGQLAGAFYGVEQLPLHWLEKLAWREKMELTAEMLAIIPPISQLSGFFAKMEQQVRHHCQGVSPESSLGLSSELYEDFYRANLILRYYYSEDKPILFDTEPCESNLSISQFDYTMCLRYITVAIRSDRFCEGLLDELEEKGDILAWCQRILQLRQQYSLEVDEY